MQYAQLRMLLVEERRRGGAPTIQQSVERVYETALYELRLNLAAFIRSETKTAYELSEVLSNALEIMIKLNHDKDLEDLPHRPDTAERFIYDTFTIQQNVNYLLENRLITSNHSMEALAHIIALGYRYGFTPGQLVEAYYKRIREDEKKSGVM